MQQNVSQNKQDEFCVSLKLSLKYNDNSTSKDTSHPYMSYLMCLNMTPKC